MSHRDKNHEPLIIDSVIEKKGASWNASTHKVARTDALRVLEALVAEYGVEASVAALDRQGLDGAAYKYLLKPMHEEATLRRQRSQRGGNAG